MFGGRMQFDVIIGNPPYQLGQSGGEAVGGFAMPIYQDFVKAAKNLEPRYIVMITPSRWFAGGRGLDSYRSEMLSDRRLRAIIDFPDASEAFPGPSIEGGVSYFVWDQSWEGDCELTTIVGGRPTSPPMKRNLSAYDVLVRRNEAVPILEKILNMNLKAGGSYLDKSVSPIQPFSIRTNFRGASSSEGISLPVKLFENGGESYISRADIPRNDPWVDEWKVLLSRAYGAGSGAPFRVYGHPIIAGPNTACTETYLVIKRFETEQEAVRFAAYLRTRLVRFLVLLRKNTQDLFSDRFKFVPDLPMDREWSDSELYLHYGLSDSEIAFVESMVREMAEANA